MKVSRTQLVREDTNQGNRKDAILLLFWDYFEMFFNRRVDLLTDASIKNPILEKQIDSTKTLIYDGRGQKYLSDIFSE